MDQIIAKIAAQLGEKEEVVEKIIRSQFDFVVNTMREGQGQSVHLHYLGKFAVKDKAIERLEKLREYKDNQ